MFYKKNLLFLIANLILLVIISFVVIYNHFKFSRNEIFVVDNTRLFNEFKMAKEIKEDGKKILSKLNNRVDSLQLVLNLETDLTRKKAAFELLLQEKENVRNFSEHFTAEQTAKIWTRIRGYIKDYSASKDNPVILGFDPSGSVLSYDNGKDITNEALTYINKRYEGNN